MMMVLGGLTADIQFKLNGDDLTISTISSLKTVEQKLTFDKSVTMKAGNNPLIAGAEIAKVMLFVTALELFKAKLQILHQFPFLRK